jgi:cytochrome c oxidase assembly protein subunit 11
MKKLDRNTRVILALVACVIGMIGLAYASVPLYSLFCRATGFGGTTQRVNALMNPVKQPVQKDRYVTISFDGNVDPALPWEFKPDIPNIRVKLGDVINISYHATNRGTSPITGTATYNVQPDKAGAYFDKIQCFCFTRQTLQPGQTVELPVQFFVDPAMIDDHQNDDVQNITLSYTFFVAKDQGRAQAAGQGNAGQEPTDTKATLNPPTANP